MLGNELPYFKFVCELIDAGIWAKMSPAARTLYPVLLRFSDRNFSPVYPGTKKLLEMTGFKQKSSLRKARNELVKLGLIQISPGTGRTNTLYHFRFDWITPRGVSSYTPENTKNHPMGITQNTSRGIQEYTSESSVRISPHNQIQISINNNILDSKVNKNKGEEKDPYKKLKSQFGEREVELAISEAKLGDLPMDPETIYKILTNKFQKSLGIDEVLNELKNKISENSLKVIKNLYLGEKDGFLVFSDKIPSYLKNILIKHVENILFEATNTETNSDLREKWRNYEY